MPPSSSPLGPGHTRQLWGLGGLCSPAQLGHSLNANCLKSGFIQAQRPRPVVWVGRKGWVGGLCAGHVPRLAAASAVSEQEAVGVHSRSRWKVGKYCAAEREAGGGAWLSVSGGVMGSFPSLRVYPSPQSRGVSYYTGRRHIGAAARLSGHVLFVAEEKDTN